MNHIRSRCRKRNVILPRASVLATRDSPILGTFQFPLCIAARTTFLPVTFVKAKRFQRSHGKIEPKCIAWSLNSTGGLLKWKRRCVCVGDVFILISCTQYCRSCGFQFRHTITAVGITIGITNSNPDKPRPADCDKVVRPRKRRREDQYKEKPSVFEHFELMFLQFIEFTRNFVRRVFESYSAAQEGNSLRAFPRNVTQNPHGGYDLVVRWSGRRRASRATSAISSFWGQDVSIILRSYHSRSAVVRDDEAIELWQKRKKFGRS